MCYLLGQQCHDHIAFKIRLEATEPGPGDLFLSVSVRPVKKKPLISTLGMFGRLLTTPTPPIAHIIGSDIVHRSHFFSLLKNKP